MTILVAHNMQIFIYFQTKPRSIFEIYKTTPCLYSNNIQYFFDSKDYIRISIVPSTYKKYYHDLFNPHIIF
jgi:hypothetical protein